MDTPCIGVCRMDELLGICVGCGRNRHEIASWIYMHDSEREAGMKVAANRLDMLFDKGWIKDAEEKDSNSR